LNRRAATDRLLLTLKIALGMLPRYLRHDLWRTAEPQHTRAVDEEAETVAARIEEGSEVEAKPRKPGLSW
jgi:hypothetical protein